MRESARLGVRGEALAAEHLEQLGFVVLAKNARIGRLELDLVARRGQLIVFCEVRTRASRGFIDPVLTIDHGKRDRVRRAARGWLHQHGLTGCEVRFDVASIVIDGETTTIDYYDAAF